MTNTIDSGSVLLVEDNQIDVDLTLLAFARNNFTKPVIVARDGAEILTLIKEWQAGHPMPKVILLDIKLPKVSGLEVLKELKNSQKTSHIPVVMLTSSTNDTDIKTAYAYGANSYIIKPVDFDKFLVLTSVFCDYWMGLNVRPEET